MNRRSFLQLSTAALVLPSLAHAGLIQKQYYWIPRVWGQNQETGNYALYSAGGWQFVSVPDPGTTDFWYPAPGLQQRSLYVPLNLPRKMYLCGADAALWTDQPHPATSELGAWVDPGGQFFHSATPNGAEAGSNFTRMITLFNMVMKPGVSNERMPPRDYHKPILFDQDAGDLLVVKGGFSAGNMGVFTGFRYQVEE